MTQHTELIKQLEASAATMPADAAVALAYKAAAAAIREQAMEIERLQKDAALVAARERERIEVLRAALKPFADFEAVRSTMGASSPKSGLLWAVHSRAGSAEISVEDMQAAIRALNTQGEGNGMED